jgi:arsenate reductase
MAEAFLKKHGGDRYEAYSAGTEPKDINPYTERVMEEIGVSLSGQYSKHIKEYMGKIHFAYVITLCDEAEKSCPAILGIVGIMWLSTLLVIRREKLAKSKSRIE